MKFINYLSAISGVSVYPMTSLLIFVVFFTVLILYAVKADRQHIAELKNLPIEDPNSLK